MNSAWKCKLFGHSAVIAGGTLIRHSVSGDRNSGPQDCAKSLLQTVPYPQLNTSFWKPVSQHPIRGRYFQKGLRGPLEDRNDQKAGTEHRSWDSGVLGRVKDVPGFVAPCNSIYQPKPLQFQHQPPRDDLVGAVLSSHPFHYNGPES